MNCAQMNTLMFLAFYAFEMVRKHLFRAVAAVPIGMCVAIVAAKPGLLQCSYHVRR
jgi:hypothetical protein